MPFDRESLLEEYEDDKDILARMVEIFDRDCAARLPKIRQAIESGDAAALSSEAHALKGGLGTFFATDTYETAYVLENLGREGNAGEDAASTFGKLESELKEFREAIDAMINS